MVIICKLWSWVMSISPATEIFCDLGSIHGLFSSQWVNRESNKNNNKLTVSTSNIYKSTKIYNFLSGDVVLIKFEHCLENQGIFQPSRSCYCRQRVKKTRKKTCKSTVMKILYQLQLRIVNNVTGFVNTNMVQIFIVQNR